VLKSRKVFFNVAMVMLLLLSSLSINVQPVMATVAPMVTGAVAIDSGHITISFNQEMALGLDYEKGFQVKINGTIASTGSLSYISNEDRTKYVLVINQGIQANQTVTLSYTGINVESTSGELLASFSNLTVMNNVKGTPPSTVYVSIGGPNEVDVEQSNYVTVGFDKGMAAPPSAPGGFSVSIDGVNKPVIAVEPHPEPLPDPIYKSNYYLKLTNPIKADQNVKVFYAPGIVKSEDGGVLQAFSRDATNYLPLRLSNISLSGSPFNYTFSPGTTIYNNVTVAANVESVKVVPTGLGIITVNGTFVTSGAESPPILLPPGVEQSITVHTVLATPVYYEDYKPRTYTINITREGPQATPTFSPAAGAITDGTSIEIISSGADHIYYTLDGTDPEASATGTTMEYSDSSKPIINGGMTVKAIAVKAGKVNSLIGSATYALMPSADLTALELSGNPSNYAFDGGIYSYHSVTVANSVEQIMVTPTGTGDITVNGTLVLSGTPSAAINLTAGSPETITVSTTEAGKSAKLYTIIVTRNLPASVVPTFEPSAGAIVDGTPVQIMFPAADHIYYTLDGTNPATAVTGTTMEYNDSSRPVINHGTTVKAIAVKAGSDNSSMGSASYTWAASADLTELALSGSPANYSFSGGTYNYNAVTVANTVASVTVTPTGIGSITVDGTTVASGTASGTIDLTAGTPKTITVSSTETGKSPKTYIITITRANSNNGSSSGSGGSSGGNGAGTGISTDITKNQTTASGNTVTATTSTTATVDAKGKATASVTQSQVSDAISRAFLEVQKKGNSVAPVVEIRVEGSNNSATSVATGIPQKSMSDIADSSTNFLSILTPIASVAFDQNSIDTISKAAAGDVTITISKVSAKILSEEAKQVVGDRPVFNFNVTSGEKTISQFNGNVTVSVPYTPKTGEDTNSIVIYYINSEGKPEAVTDCSYDSKTGMITFKTTHFSQYAVGYNKVSFNDVSSTAWYSNAVSYVAARGISTGVGNGNYEPAAKLTRGQFLVMVMRAYGLSADSSSKDNFSDAGNMYYTGYLATAKKLGITDGIGNDRFAPEKEITRQEMFTLLYNTLKQINELPTSTTAKTLTAYSDSSQVANWANPAMTLFAGTGIISGNGGKINPKNTTNRAEMAQVLYKLMII